jgi:hypothetical protein
MTRTAMFLPSVEPTQQNSDKFKTAEMRSGSRYTVVPQGFAHLVYQGIAASGVTQIRPCRVS